MGLRRYVEHALARGMVRLVKPKRLLPPGRELEPSCWDLDVVDDGLCLHGLRLSALARTYGSPLYVIDGERLEKNALAFLGVGAAGRVTYSYKTNPVPAVLRRLHALGIAAEVISEHEFDLALRLGANPKTLVFNGPVKSAAALETAIRLGVGLINANSFEELAFLDAIAARARVVARVGLRVIVAGGWTGQFGVPHAGGHARDAFVAAKRFAHLDLCAVHVHRGRGFAAAEEIAAFAAAAMEVVALARAAGHAITELDVGGSMPVPTVRPLSRRDRTRSGTLLLPPEPPDLEAIPTIERYLEVLVAQVQERAAALALPVPRLILEPGRAMTGNTQLLLTSVVTGHDSHKGFRYAFLDAGINLAAAAQGNRHQLFCADRVSGARDTTYRLVGPICTPGDVLFTAERLRPLVTGDVLAIMDAGAYFVPFSTAFSFPRPAIVWVDSRGSCLVRRAETTDDIIQRDLGPGIAGSAPSEAAWSVPLPGCRGTADGT